MNWNQSVKGKRWSEAVWWRVKVLYWALPTCNCSLRKDFYFEGLVREPRTVYVPLVPLRAPYVASTFCILSLKSNYLDSQHIHLQSVFKWSLLLILWLKFKMTRTSNFTWGKFFTPHYKILINDLFSGLNSAQTLLTHSTFNFCREMSLNTTFKEEYCQ